MDATTTYVECGCHCHLVAVNSWDDGDLYMNLWSPIQSKEWGRLYWMWQSLRGRWNGQNEVVLNDDEATQLRDALTAHLEREKA